MDSIAALRAEIAACRHCAAELDHGPRPVVQIGAGARILVIGQAPGRRVHESGVPWDDDSGNRLRDWLGMMPQQFYDPDKLALVPMGFCYPGKSSSGDLPPRRECAPLWHERVLAQLAPDRLTVLVGTYAHAAYGPDSPKGTLAERVRVGTGRDDLFLLPHPSWRVVGSIRQNPWFETETLPRLQAAVGARIGQ